MAVVYALSEFTDEKGTDWKVKIVDGTISTGDLNHRFTLGPDGFRLSYDYDNFDRVKPILGSRVQFTLFHPDSSDAAFNTLYNNLDTAVEGTYRVEIYRDPDGVNEVWWVGEILPEQVIIPDAYPNAPVQITAVDGLANLKGIEYNNSGTAYEGAEMLTAHLHKALSKVHSYNFWGASDTFIKFFEDFIGDEYKDHIAGGQNQQLNNAKLHHKAFYNKDDSGINQFFSTYKVLESMAMTFNSVVFMAQGTFWFVPLGAIQGHASNDLDIAHFISGNGTITYNTSSNMSFSVPFGNNSTDYEKLSGWERSSSPAFKEVTRTRNYQGNKPLVKDSKYEESDLVSGTVLDDEDADYSTGIQYLISGYLLYEYDGDGVSADNERAGRVRLDIKLKIGDAGGTTRYLKRDVGYNTSSYEVAQFYDDAQDTNTTSALYLEGLFDNTTWAAADSTYSLLSWPFDKKEGTSIATGIVHIPVQIITPAIPATATGIELSATLHGVNEIGGNDTALVNTTNSDFTLYDFAVFIYDNNNAETADKAIITSKNADPARYLMSQGETLIGDRITDNDLGHIVVNNGSAYVDPSDWDSIHNTTGLALNKLGVVERLAANKLAVRTERGTIYRVGSKFIHPYTILTNSDDSNNFYQVTGLDFVASRCEYDLECMYLTRNVTGITVVQDDVKGEGPQGPIPVVWTPKGPGSGNIAEENQTKTQHINIDSYGISGLKMTNGSSGTNTYSFPTALPSSSNRNLMLLKDDGAIVKIASGSAGQVLTMHSGGLYPEWAAGGESGWFNNTTLMKVMPSQFIMNDDYTRAPVMVEDDTAGYLGIKAPSTSSELYAFVAIPTGYKATHVQVYASASTSSAVTAYSFNQTSGAIVSKGTGDFNSSIDITDITSSNSINLAIKLAPASTSTIIYGADVTIAAV